MKFRTRNGEVRIALLSGHVAVVSEGLNELEERFHSEAYSKGCMDENMAANFGGKKVSQVPPAGGAMSPEERAEKIFVAVEEIMANGDPADMTSAGLVKVERISAIVGFEITASERNDAMEEIN